MKTRKTVNQNNRELKDEELKEVNGGMKIFLLDKPNFLTPLLRLIFKIKKKDND